MWGGDRVRTLPPFDGEIRQHTTFLSTHQRRVLVLHWPKLTSLPSEYITVTLLSRLSAQKVENSGTDTLFFVMRRFMPLRRTSGRWLAALSLFPIFPFPSLSCFRDWFASFSHL